MTAASRFLRRHVRFLVFAVVSTTVTLWIAAEIVGFELGGSAYSLQATFDDATNLRSGDPVRLAGVPVGQVRSIGIDMGTAVVEFDVESSVELPEDSHVAVASENIIGMRELVLTPGDSSALLEGGDRIERTSSAVEVGNLINELGPLLESLDPKRLNELVTTLNEALQGNRETVAGISDDLVTVLDRFASRSATIAQLIDDYEVILGEVGRRDRQLQQLVDDVVSIAATFEESEAVLLRALDELPGFSQRLDALLGANAANIESVLGDLSLLTDTVASNLDLLDDALRVTPPALAAISRVTSAGDYITTNFLCVATAPPPCPTPVGDAPESGAPGVGTTIAEILGALLEP